MTRHDVVARRLFVRSDLAAGGVVDLDRAQANHLANVLRMKDGDAVLVFNGRDGEWSTRLVDAGRKRWRLEVAERTQPQPPVPDLHYLFAPLKQARLDYMVQKAVEMGVGRLRPVLTSRTQVARVNRDRVEANAIGAAEQCGILSISLVDDVVPLADVLVGWVEREADRRVIFCDEGDMRADPLSVLAVLPPSPLAVLVGPEGGFAPDEQQWLRELPFVTQLPLGPRILRADTAAVAALALVQATLGDWRACPPHPGQR